MKSIGKYFGKILICFGIFAWQPLSIPVKSRESSGVVFGDSYQKEHSCIVAALYEESRGEPEEGQRAVMQVILNRKNHKSFPSTFCSVIKQKGQFSFVGKNQNLVIKPLKALDKEVHAKVASIAHEALQGRFEEVLDRDVLYYAHIKVKNHWTRRFVKVKIVQSHVFYKEI